MKSSKNQRPVVIIDVDGVCVKWQSGLPYYLAKNAMCSKNALECNLTEEFMSPEQLFGCDSEIANIYMEDYNKSDFIKYLAPYQDALEMINDKKSEWDFVAATALGTSKETVQNRLFNLNALFPNAFKDIFVCEFGEPKDSMLQRIHEKYDNIIMFIDDIHSNIESAARVLPSSVLKYHILRGPADRPHVYGYHHIKAKDLNSVINHYNSYDKDLPF